MALLEVAGVEVVKEEWKSKRERKRRAWRAGGFVGIVREWRVVWLEKF